MMHLQNERLKIEMAVPGISYRGSRFDWSAFITQVTLDGRHTFCAPESLEKGQGSGGYGLCNEFGIFAPVGYEEAEPGEGFPKLGVGVLRKLDQQPYFFETPYPIEPYPLTLQETNDAVLFQFEPLPCRGYAVRLQKKLSLRENRIRIEYCLENVGEKPICTHEYGHNFLAINGAIPGPDYQLDLDDGLNLRRKPAYLQQEGTQVRWSENPRQAAISVTSGKLGHVSANPIWQLWHEPSEVGVSETLVGPMASLTLFWAPHVLSPEVFVDIELTAGQSMEWAREYEFFNRQDIKARA